MKNVLELEFRRLFRAKAFYICILISLALILITAATSKIMLNAINTEELPEGVTVNMMAPTALSMMKGIGSSNVTTLLAIFVALFATEDYAGDIIKNIYARGYTRTEVYVAKYVVTFVGSIIFIAVTALFSLLIGATFFDGIGTAGKNYVGSLLAIALCLVAYFTIYFAVAVSLQKTGGSIAISIFGPLIVGLLISLLSAMLKLDDVDLADYWLTDRVTILQQADVAGKEIWIGCVIAVVVIAAGITIGYFLHKRREA
ncbi:MAG: ABC transporter permease [Clostridia bacterium]|nr:ABC transporter permease [Clostridia bacterium]